MGVLGKDPYAPEAALYSLPFLARRALPKLDLETEK